MPMSDLAGLAVVAMPVVAALVWVWSIERTERAAALVRADIHAGVRRALGGESLLAIDVEYPMLWRPGCVRLATPSGYESLIMQGARAVMERLPAGYEIVIHCGGGS
jgi:hypothetical protein